ncbi:lipase 1-like [Scaptodrosophila lebanonensis]|uniref:Lipase n=1 Tax=Drosophila lebanonensis TaxID=7225 RepID=A0A6J2U7R0_DROLE|nr:lipase 1-like [Scaptodrosophila lebanonensis]
MRNNMQYSKYWLNGLSLAIQLAISGAGFLEQNYPPSVIEDAHLTTLELLAKYNYPNEAHFVTTSDNYILGMHRIPRPGAQPVLLVHGLLDSSSTWIMMGPQSGLAYYLYDSGYDVWLGNCRGNTYSRNHTSLNPNKDRAFWNFSWHEMGIYDLPAMIDTVLDVSGFKKLTYYGHSQGTTVFFVMASSLPAYNDNVHLMNALAPAVFVQHTKTPLLDMGLSMKNVFLTDNGPSEIMPRSEMGLDFCFMSSYWLKFCMRFTRLLFGGNGKSHNKTMYPVMFGHCPAGCSTLQVNHFLQMVRSGRFRPYNFYLKRNQRIYGTSKPPDYQLQRVTAPIALYFTKDDFLTVPEDVQRLAKQLPKVVVNHLYENPEWNHVDMVWAPNLRQEAQPQMMANSKKWETTDE